MNGPRTRRTIVTGLLAGLILIPAAAPASAAPAPTKPDAAVLQAALDAITAAGMPGTLAQVRDGKHTWDGASGVADLDTGRPMRSGYQHRVGSITKTFVATTLLQLVGERRVELDAPIGTYLPEFTRDGVTVRTLLNHTSGIGNYTNALLVTVEDVEEAQHTTYDPRELVRIGYAMPPTNTPGAAYAYSNTNYILAGLIIEKVTGHPVRLEVSARIIWPLGLWQTYFPGPTTRILGPHSEGYVPWTDGIHDFSVFNMSWAGAAGELVSTAGDLNRFYRALLTGKLLRPAQLTQMQTTPEFSNYGLGLYAIETPCGTFWGHDGLVLGYSTFSFHSPDGRRQASFGFNLTHYQVPGEPDPIGPSFLAFLGTALCGPQPAARSTGGEQPVFVDQGAVRLV